MNPIASGLFLSSILLVSLSCKKKADDDRPTVPGTVSFRLGGGAATGLIQAEMKPANHAGDSTFNLLDAGDSYLVSPNKAQITFTSIVFRGLGGDTLGISTFTDCTVTYDSSLASGTTLLDCPFSAPVADIYQMAVYFDKSLQLLVSDEAVGIYSDPLSPTSYSSSKPSGGASYIPFKITIGDGTSRATPILLPSVWTVTEGTSPKLYITTDMIHTVQLTVDSGGQTLSLAGTNDPVVLFGGPTPSSSLYYSGAKTTGAIRVQGTPSLRIFEDAAGHPLHAMGTTCGSDGPKEAWATPPIGSKIGGWLGKDSNNNIAWALPSDTSYSSYSAYFVMAEQTTVGQTTTLNCKATSAPPPPIDGKTYASGAPEMPVPTTKTVLTLLAK